MGEEPEQRELQDASDSEDNDETLQRIELRSRKDPSEKEEVESEEHEDTWNTILDEEIDRFDEEDLIRAIRERLRAYRYEMHREDEPFEEELKEVKVEVKKEMIFTVPMNTANHAEVRQTIKGLVEFIEDRLKLTVNKVVGIKDGPRIREAYEVLDDWYRERHIKRIQEKGIGRRKKARIRMMKWKTKRNLQRRTGRTRRDRVSYWKQR